jgi:excisionase family DNA binding protein
MDAHDDVRFLRVEEVAQEARVSHSTVRHWLRVGRLESVKLGKRRVVPRAAFERFITSGTAPLRPVVADETARRSVATGEPHNSAPIIRERPRSGPQREQKRHRSA